MAVSYKSIPQLLTLLVLCAWCVHSQDTTECRVVDQCTCRTPSGWEYSLWPIDNKTSPTFHNIPGEGYRSPFTFDYSPCTPFNDGKCKNVFLCQKYKQMLSHTYAIGMNNTFQPEFVEGALEFHYSGHDTRTARIILNCNPNSTVPEITRPAERRLRTGSVYTIILTSMHACPIKTKFTYVPTTTTTTTSTQPITKKQVTKKPTTKPSTKVATTMRKYVSTRPQPTCPPCPTKISYERELAVAIILLLVVQLVSYVVIGFVCYRKIYARQMKQYEHKSFKNLDQTVTEDNPCYANY